MKSINLKPLETVFYEFYQLCPGCLILKLGMLVTTNSRTHQTNQAYAKFLTVEFFLQNYILVRRIQRDPSEYIVMKKLCLKSM